MPLKFYDARSYCILPYSSLTGKRVHPAERAVENALVRELVTRGYRYTTNIDSCDCFASIKLDSATGSYDNIHCSYTPPHLKNIEPFQPSDDLDVNAPLERVVRPRVELFIYNAKTHVCEAECVGVIVDSNASYASVARNILSILVDQTIDKYGSLAVDSLIGAGWSGIGFEITLAPGGHRWPQITRILDGSPAASSRLRISDFLITLDGQTLDGLDQFEFYRRMKGDIGRRIVLQAKRGNQLINDTLVYTARSKIN